MPASWRELLQRGLLAYSGLVDNNHALPDPVGIYWGDEGGATGADMAKRLADKWLERLEDTAGMAWPHIKCRTANSREGSVLETGSGPGGTHRAGVSRLGRRARVREREGDVMDINRLAWRELPCGLGEFRDDGDILPARVVVVEVLNGELSKGDTRSGFGFFSVVVDSVKPVALARTAHADLRKGTARYGTAHRQNRSQLGLNRWRTAR